MHALIIDDDPQVRSFLAAALHDSGWQVAEADSAATALEKLDNQNWTVVLCDVVLGDADGFTVLRRIKEELPDSKVVMITGHGSASGALDATAYGAYDYLLKPFTVDDLQRLLDGVREQARKNGSRSSKTNQSKRQEPFLIGASEAFIRVMKQVGRVSGTNLPVMLTGESGTGKEVVAAALHRRSQRADKPFVAVNCGAIPAELIESELFGHMRGSFTGADRDRVGLWEEADGGTVFLDEITETTQAFQVKLLRALQQGEIRRVGSNRIQKVDVRVIAASNRDVDAEVRAGRFREDLYYRLNAVSIVLPPLRERKGDILPLAMSLLRRAYPTQSVAFEADALEALENYDWPGNVRELENAVVRAAAMCDETIRRDDLPDRVRMAQATPQVTDQTLLEEHEALLPLSEIEARYVAQVFAHTQGNKQAAARILQVDRKTLERMLRRHNIEMPFARTPLRVA